MWCPGSKQYIKTGSHHCVDGKNLTSHNKKIIFFCRLRFRECLGKGVMYSLRPGVVQYCVCTKNIAGKDILARDSVKESEKLSATRYNLVQT